MNMEGQITQKHNVEAKDSWKMHLNRLSETNGQQEISLVSTGHRHLKKNGENHKHHGHHKDHENDKHHGGDKDEDRRSQIYQLNQELDKEYQEQEIELDAKATQKRIKKEAKRKKHLNEMYNNPAIKGKTVHGMMIDAGSTGTRLHLYEWNPRTLRSEREVEDAVTGGRLSYPGTDSRWTDRLSPGLATFAALPDDQLVDGIAAYLQPLMDFATTVLHTKQAEFASFPVYLRATAGMRVITQVDRARVVSAVRTLFSNNTYCPFHFEDEQVRVLSGEEEAIFGWAGVNFLLGTLIEDSEGSGTVNEPRLTYGALDMGGASTQISFYEPNGEIMANLFKLQIGQGKHWNLYAHSFLFYGINEAENRLVAKLINEKSWTERLIHGINNPCYFGGTIRNVRSEMHINADGYETWENVTDEKYGVDESSNDGYLNAILRNDDSGGNFDMCMELAYHLLHKEQNEWCNFSHRGDCSFAGIYQPDLPEQSTKYGEFLAFSNYYAVWTFLGLPSRSSLRDVQVAARTYCEMSLEDVTNIAGHRLEDGEDIVDYCFRSVYVFQILHNGYGFELDDCVTSAGVVSGQKVGWALGAMLYEINTLPWHYDPVSLPGSGHPIATGFFSVLVLVLCIGLYSVFRAQRKRRAQREGYDFIKTIHA